MKSTNVRVGLDAVGRCTLPWGPLPPVAVVGHNVGQACIVALLVERVHIVSDGLNVSLRLDGLDGLAREMLVGGIGEAA